MLGESLGFFIFLTHTRPAMLNDSKLMKDSNVKTNMSLVLSRWSKDFTERDPEWREVLKITRTLTSWSLLLIITCNMQRYGGIDANQTPLSHKQTLNFTELQLHLIMVLGAIPKN